MIFSKMFQLKPNIFLAQVCSNVTTLIGNVYGDTEFSDCLKLG